MWVRNTLVFYVAYNLIPHVRSLLLILPKLFSTMDLYPVSDEDFSDPKANPVEDDPPNLAVEGFRPGDYTVNSFHVGLRVRWVTSKSAKVWLDGFITKVEITLELGCIISILEVGNTDQDTYKEVFFPSGIHEIHLPPVPAHMQLSQTSLQKGFSISFCYNEVWELGWVIKFLGHTCHLEFLNGHNGKFLRSKMKDITFIQIPRNFVYGGTWQILTLF